MRYWKMNVARFSNEFKEKYFKLLSNLLSTPNLDLESLLYTLYDIPTHKDRRSLQSSFATKMLNTINPNQVIYDSLVCEFYNIKPKYNQKELSLKIDKTVHICNFLSDEYDIVLKGGILKSAIEHFKIVLKPKHFSDKKIIDSLIWGYMRACKMEKL
jgi:predicted nuclease of restriction endonuclease-like (RecB) superfamily